MRRASLAAIAYGAALIPLVGCGGDSTVTADGGPGSGGDSSAVEPCSLVSDEEMAGILEDQLPDEGAVTVTSQSAPLDVGGTCRYTWSGTASTGKEFSISLFPAENLDISAGSGERTAIPGVGDEAFESADNYYARVGDLAIHLVNLQEGHKASVAVLTAAVEGL